ncbi:14166_t:CDS:2 [Racocetra fulgida]|uniref:14166_t:CDS:1 n=1 Tax=Racocetra fulgida TaxID=60492 RepID=A0A9N9ILB0_9GLOM|nr:14166_t:CDS:2 [Racocetra fulgida]
MVAITEDKDKIKLLQNYIDAILTDKDHERIKGCKRLEDGQKPLPRWNPFDNNQQQLVTELDAEYKLIHINAKNDDERIKLFFKVADKVQAQLNDVTTYDPNLVKDAFTIFINNHPVAIAWVAVGLDPVVPLKNYYYPIPEGYLPNKYLRDYNEKTSASDLQPKFDYRLPYSSIDKEWSSY